jgi:hypothetical protein
MEVICSSKTLVDSQQTSRHYIPEAGTLHTHHCENLKSYTVFSNFVVKEELLKVLHMRKWIKGEDICNTFRTCKMEIRMPLHRLSVITTDGVGTYSDGLHQDSLFPTRRIILSVLFVLSLGSFVCYTFVWARHESFITIINAFMQCICSISFWW